MEKRFHLKISEVKPDSCGSDPDKDETSLDDQEDRLALELKQICDENGKEKDPELAAPILHKMAKVYHKRLPDMLSAIKSAALYNAAIARSSAAKDTEKDLRQLCKDILTQANANKTDADLIEKSKQIKQEVIKMRQNAEQILNEVELIPDDAEGDRLKMLEMVKIRVVNRLQIQITNDYTQTMANVARYCESVMGEPTCRFALGGMGSLARKEITPFSDFENFLLLENDAINRANYHNILNYFRWFSVIFQIILINLHETIIPSVAIASLNDKASKHGDWFYDAFTTRGISFDGMMPHASKFPLGRVPTELKPWKTELIQPVNEMLKYLNSDVSKKNGYHLNDILTKTCFVYKDKEVYDEFEQGVFDILEENREKEDVAKEVETQITDDLGKFATRSTLSNLNTKKKLNVKQVVYRSTTLFISALGRIYNIRASSCFEIVAILARKREISAYAKHKLMYAVALACEVRLRWYFRNQRQCDELTNDENLSAVHTLLGVVGRPSTISYFQIAYALQCDIAKRLNLRKVHVYSNPSILNLSIGHCFDDRVTLENFTESKGKVGSEAKQHYGFDESLKRLEKNPQLEVKSSVKDPIAAADNQLETLPKKFLQQVLNAVEILAIGFALSELGYHHDLQEYFQYLEKIQENSETYENIRSSLLKDENIVAHNYYLLGQSFQETNQSKKAEESFKKYLDIRQKQLSKADNDKDAAERLREIGSMLIELNKPDEAIPYFEQMLEIASSESSVLPGNTTTVALHLIGKCFQSMKQPKEAMTYFTRSLQTMQQPLDSMEELEKVLGILLSIGSCLMNMSKPDEAVTYMLKWWDYFYSSKYYQNADLSEKLPDGFTRKSASLLLCTGRCFLDLKIPQNAIKYMTQALHLQKSCSRDVGIDNGVRETLLWISQCYIQMEQGVIALEYVKRALAICERQYQETGVDSGYAAMLFKIGIYCMNLEQEDEAMKYFTKGLKLAERDSVNIDADVDIANMLAVMGKCFFNMGKPDEALHYLKKYLLIREQVSSDLNADDEDAEIFFLIGRCLRTTDQLKEAIQYFQRSLCIYERLSLDLSADKDVCNSLYLLGMSLMETGKPRKGIHFLKRALEISRKVSSNLHSNDVWANTQYWVGRCLLKLRKNNEALDHFKSLLAIQEPKADAAHSDLKQFRDTHFYIGECLNNLKEPSKAIKYFQMSLQIHKNLSQEARAEDSYTVSTVFTIGGCLRAANQAEEALQCFEKCLQIEERITSDITTDNKIANTLNSIGLCLLDLNQPKEAKSAFERSLEIRNKATIDFAQSLVDRSVNDLFSADTLHWIGCCHMYLNDSEKANECLENSQRKMERIMNTIFQRRNN